MNKKTKIELKILGRMIGSLALIEVGNAIGRYTTGMFLEIIGLIIMCIGVSFIYDPFREYYENRSI